MNAEKSLLCRILSSPKTLPSRNHSWLVVTGCLAGVPANPLHDKLEILAEERLQGDGVPAKKWEGKEEKNQDADQSLVHIVHYMPACCVCVPGVEGWSGMRAYRLGVWRRGTD